MQLNLKISSLKNEFDIYAFGICKLDE